MDYFSSSFDPQNIGELHYITPDFVPQLEEVGSDDHIIPTFEQENDVDFLVDGQLLTFTKKPPLDQTKPKKRSLKSCLTVVDHDQETKSDINNDNERMKKKKILHKEVERQRRLEMSSLHTSLKSLLPLEHIKGKRSISDYVEEATKYIKKMQQKIQVLNDKKNALISKKDSNLKGQGIINDVIVNDFKGCLEVIVITNCGDDDDDDGDQGLPLSKVLQCLIQEGLDVVNSMSKRVNNNVVHSIHAQVDDEKSITINATNLKEKLANIR